jgi:hypothetical protein
MYDCTNTKEYLMLIKFVKTQNMNLLILMLEYNLSHNYTENTITANRETIGQFYPNTQPQTYKS